MSRESVHALGERPEEQRRPEAVEDGGQAGLAARLAHLERAYDDLLERVHRYEQERAEIRARLGRLLGRIDDSGSNGR
jgi:hypothetical protein